VNIHILYAREKLALSGFLKNVRFRRLQEIEPQLNSADLAVILPGLGVRWMNGDILPIDPLLLYSLLSSWSCSVRSLISRSYRVERLVGSIDLLAGRRLVWLK
jgi:hypothetical protein